MLAKNDEFAVLVHRIREGSDEAMLELVENYGPYVYRAVRRKLNRAIRSKFDSGDFVQAVWASFFENRKQVMDFSSPRDLIVFLARVARNKVIDEIRRRLVLQGKNVNREVRLDWSDAQKTLASPGPTASEVCMAEERFQQITGGDSVRHRQVIELRQSGATHLEIAEVLGIDPKTVQRVMRRLEREVDL